MNCKARKDDNKDITSTGICPLCSIYRQTLERGNTDEPIDPATLSEEQIEDIREILKKYIDRGFTWTWGSFVDFDDEKKHKYIKEIIKNIKNPEKEKTSEGDMETREPNHPPLNKK